MWRIACYCGSGLLLLVSAAAARAANPGLKAVADTSTDSVVAEVLTTQPRKAMEGARDTARFKVVRTLKGPLEPGDEFGVCYHLLWIDAERQSLEPPKFEAGKLYTLFLVKDKGFGPRHYNLADQWLAVLPVHPELDRYVARELNEVGDIWSHYWRTQYAAKSPLRASSSRIEIVPAGNVTHTARGLGLSINITNYSPRPITARLARQWHGGEAPRTDLFASATHVQAKQANPLEPVYLLDEAEGGSAAATTRILAGDSATVTLRMDWPGTGSVVATPLIGSAQSEAYLRVLLVFEGGENGGYEYAASATTYIHVDPQ
jgi:hypothetical protein